MGIDVENVLKNLSVPKQLALISKYQPSDQAHLVTDKKLSELSFLKIVDASSIDWSFKINRFKVPEKADPDVDLTKKRLFYLSEADLLVFAPSLAGGFSLLHGSADWQLSLKGAAGAPISAHPPKGENEDGILNWILNTLGYNGVVLKVALPYVYIASYVSALKPEAQGVAFAASSAKNRLTADSSEISALMQLIESQEYVGKFEVLLQKDSAIEVGDKVFLSY